MGPDCDDLLHEVADFLHGELDPERTAQLRSHLEGCPPCFETADFQAQLRQLVSKRCREEVPADFQARVTAMLRVEISVSPPDSAGPTTPS
jgi:anti-sigma factor (TIGR02949 family)